MTREELYDLVWSNPVSTIAKDLGVSDVYLGRVCGSLEVPTPPRGYWRRLATGKAHPRPELPDPRPGVPRVWTKGKATAQPAAQRPRYQAEPARPSAGRRRRPPHELVKEAEEHYRESEHGVDGYLRPRKKLLPDIITSRDGAARCLRLASDLFHVLESRGHRVMIAPAFERLIRPDPLLTKNDGAGALWSPLRPTVAYIHGVPIGLCVMEAAAKKELRYVGEGRFIPEKDYRPDRHPGPTSKVERSIPTGLIELIAYSPFHGFPWVKEWAETPKWSLCSGIDGITTVIEGGAVGLGIELEKAGRYF